MPFYKSKGYFNNNTTYVIEVSSRKTKGYNAYSLDWGIHILIDSVTFQITFSALDSIHKANKKQFVYKARST